MSDLTPDGDLAKSAKVAIRSLTSREMPILSARERALLQDWSTRCSDQANGARLMQIAKRLQSSR